MTARTSSSSPSGLSSYMMDMSCFPRPDSLTGSQMGMLDATHGCDNVEREPLSQTFRLFSKLPTELRLKIWSMNLPESRLLPIRCGPKSPSLPEAALFTGSWSSGCTSSAPVPANLHACAESRAEALKTHALSLGWAGGPGQVFLRPDADVLYFGPRDGYMLAESQFHSCMALCDQDELAAVRRVAISDALFWVGGSYMSMTAASITVGVVQQLALRMHALDEVVFVPRDEDLLVDPRAACDRMARQIATAMHTVNQQFKYWSPPAWRISPLSALGP